METDPNRVKQIIINLVSNAIKYTQEGSVTIHTVLSNSLSNSFLEISVTDTGVGMSKS